MTDLMAEVGGGVARTIRLASGTYEFRSTMTIDRDLTLEAAAGASPVLTGLGATRLFRISGSGAVAFTGLEITEGGNGGSTDYAHMAYISGSPQITFTRCDIHAHRSGWIAGVLVTYDTPSILFVECQIHDNTGSGSLAYMYGGSLSLVKCTLSNNDVRAPPLCSVMLVFRAGEATGELRL